MIQFRRNYFIATVFVFLTEVLIAKYLNDDFIRPYVGDTIATIFVYLFLMSFIRIKGNWAVLIALLFSYLIEFSQHVNLIGFLGLSENKAAILLIGKNASWEDIIAYTAGALIILFSSKLSKLTSNKKNHETA